MDSIVRQVITYVYGADRGREVDTLTRSIWKMLGPFATASRRYIASHQVSLVARQL